MKNNALVRYFIDCWNELKKVTWPTKQQSVKLAGITLVFVFASAVMLAFFDFIFSKGYSFLLSVASGV